MGLPKWARQSVEIRQPTWVVDRGVQKTATYTGAKTTVTGCSVQPGGSSEDLSLRQHTTVRFTLIAPEGTEINEHTEVTFNGVAYSVDGAPEVWPSPTKRLNHVKAILVDWRG